VNSPIFFFTAEDPREIPKGSRDPLRFLPVWTPIARQMIPYLTTVTPSYRGFLTRFLFHGLLEEFEPVLANGSIDDQWTVFCKFEQLCAFVRSKLSNPTPNFPGISGIVEERIADDKVITVGSDSIYWLVRSQNTTGYWGYYHQASLGSRLIRQNSALRPGYRLTDDAQKIFESSTARSILLQHEQGLRQLFQNKPAKFLLKDFEDLSELFALKPLQGDEAWSKFWLSHLLVPEHLPSSCFSQATVRDFASRIESLDLKELKFGDIWEQLSLGNPDSQVTRFANEVKAAEAIIGVCEWVFDACRMRRESQSLIDCANWARSNGFNDEWLDKIRLLPEPYDTDLKCFRAIANQGPASFEELARVLLDRHKNIMRSRKGASWVELTPDDTLLIRDPSNGPNDPMSEKYSSGIRWRYDYFLPSWLSVGREIGFIPDYKNG